MQQPEIRSLSSPSFDSLSEFEPKDPTFFGFQLVLEIGKAGEEGADLYYMHVCSPTWFAEAMRTSEKFKLKAEFGYLAGRHFLFAPEYSYRGLIDTLESLLAWCRSETWDEVNDKLRRIARWEYEDYDADRPRIFY